MNQCAPFRPSATGEDPRAQVARIEAAADRRVTPCADGGMAWRTWGAGDPVILFHGGHGSWTHWIRNVPILSRRHRVIAADLPGHGDSAYPPPPHEADGFARIVSAGLDAVLDEGERAVLVGFSFGAVIAGHVARQRPDRIGRLVLVGAAGLDLPRAPRPDMSSWRNLADETARARAHHRNLEALMISDPDRVDPLAVHLQAENARHARIRTHLISRTDALRRCLPQLAMPLDGIWGVHDVTARGYLDLRRDLLRGTDPDAGFEVIDDAGHWVQYEAADAFHAALDRLLARRRADRRTSPEPA